MGVNSSQGGGSKYTWILATSAPGATGESRDDEVIVAGAAPEALPAPSVDPPMIRAGDQTQHQQQQQQQQCRLKEVRRDPRP